METRTNIITKGGDIEIMKGSHRKTCKGCGDDLYGREDSDGSYFYHCSICGSMWTLKRGWEMLEEKSRIARIRRSKKEKTKNKNRAEMQEHNIKVWAYAKERENEKKRKR